MATNGPVAIQGCAYRISRLAADGSIVDSAISVIQDDRPLVKLEAKPEMVAGQEFTPISACGVPVISYKDCDRYKRWSLTLTLGDFDPEQLELVTQQGQVLTASGSAGRSFADGAFSLYENTLDSPADAAFTVDDVGRPVTDPGFTVATCTTVSASNAVSTTASFASVFVVAGMTVTGTGIAAGTVVLEVVDATHVTLSKNATASGTVTLTFFSIPANTFITEYVSATEVRMSAGALKTLSGITVTLGAQPVGTIGYAYPGLLLTACPFGVSIEVWSKLIVRGTGYQGTTPYPSAGTPEIPGSAYVRTGIFRAFLWHDAYTIENKEQTPMFTGWAIENPNFGTGPADDWRESALPGVGPAVPTTAWCDMMCDFELPGVAANTGIIGPGYQAVPMT